MKTILSLNIFCLNLEIYIANILNMNVID